MKNERLFNRAAVFLSHRVIHHIIQSTRHTINMALNPYF